MASHWYTKGLKKCFDGTIDLSSVTLKVMLVGVANTAYVPDKDQEFVDPGTNNSADPSYCEAQATNYAGGFSGGGRKTVTLTITANLGSDRVEFALDNQTYTALGGATNDQITAAIVYVEGSSDADSCLLYYQDGPNTFTNGQDFVVQFANPAAYIST